MPKGADNDGLILAAARRLFLAHGYGATSMDAVAHAAGVSKATVYARFDSKDGLFAAMVERQGEGQSVALEAAPDAEVADVLHRFGHDAAELLLSEPVIAFHRIVASEATRSPGVGPLFFSNGPERLLGDLEAYLRQAMVRGALRPADARLAAAQFLAIIVGDLQLRSLMGLGRRATAERRAQVAGAGVDAFLRAYAPDDS